MWFFDLQLTFVSVLGSEHRVPSDQWAWLVIHEDIFDDISRQYKRLHLG